MTPQSQFTTTDWFTTRQLDARTWAIGDCGSDLIYLVCGEGRALLIDTGWGVGDLPALTDSLLDAHVEGGMPLTVVNTHGHPDHTYGNGQFSQVYVSPGDIGWLEAPPPLENRRWIARLLLPRPLPRGFEVENWAATVPDSLLPVEGGHRFRLGGRNLGVIDGWEGGVEEGLPLTWHLDRLRECGFCAVDCFARWDCDALYGGPKEERQES